MKNLSRDAKLAIGILIALLIITALAATQQQTRAAVSQIIESFLRAGWCPGFEVVGEGTAIQRGRAGARNFIPPKDASILFMLEPLFPTESEMQPMDDWVEAGGTLIAIGEQYGMYLLLDHYDFTLHFLPENGDPCRRDPAIEFSGCSRPEKCQGQAVLQSERDDFVVLVAYQGKPVLVSFEQGKGRVILGTVADPSPTPA